MKKKHGYRILFYALGMVVLALGITLNTKTNLGVSPLISVAYSASQMTNINLGDITLLWYVVFVLVQIFCHLGKKQYKRILLDVLQIPLSIAFTRFMNLFAAWIPDMNGNIVVRVLLLLVAIVLTGFGIVFTLNTRLIPNPGDGIVQVLSDCTGKKVSTVKNCLDAICVLITIGISLMFSGKVIGIGLGTILAVLFVGRVVAVGNYFFKNKILVLSGLEQEIGEGKNEV